MWRALKVSLGVTLLCLVIGYPMAHLIANSPPGRANLLLVLVPLSFNAEPYFTFTEGMLRLDPEAYSSLGLSQTYIGIILAHAVFGAPFVVITVSATLAGFDWTVMRAAANLGANPLVAFRRVQLPLILPGVISGSLFAFAAWFDELVIVLFMGGLEQGLRPSGCFGIATARLPPCCTQTAAPTRPCRERDRRGRRSVRRSRPG